MKLEFEKDWRIPKLEFHPAFKPRPRMRRLGLNAIHHAAGITARHENLFSR
jgi:hypothetical protein